MTKVDGFARSHGAAIAGIAWLLIACSCRNHNSDASLTPEPARVSATSVSSAPSVRIARSRPTNNLPISECDAGSEAFGCCTEEGYKLLQEMTKNRTVDECRVIDRLESFRNCPTPIARGMHGVIADCMKSAMNRELDLRLVPLKAAAPEAFRREMGMQAAYLRGVRETCDPELTPSTGDFGGYFSCLVDLYERRADEALLINERRLKLRDPTHAATTLKDFRTYAEGLCAMPPDLWEGARSPSSCVETVLKSIP